MYYNIHWAEYKTNVSATFVRIYDGQRGWVAYKKFLSKHNTRQDSFSIRDVSNSNYLPSLVHFKASPVNNFSSKVNTTARALKQLEANNNKLVELHK